MYLPYLRGKQFELLALRELAKSGLTLNNISPIIEPVKKDLKSIETAIKALSKISVKIFLIVNPEEGDLKKDNKSIIELIHTLKAEGIQSVFPSFIINSETDFDFFENEIELTNINNGYLLLRFNQIRSEFKLKQISENSNILYNGNL